MDEVRDEVLRLKREELKARLLRSIEQDELKRSTYTVSNDWVDDIIAKEEKERFEYIEKNYEFIEQKILNRTPTPSSIKRLYFSSFNFLNR